jgi:hypothetical protein
MALLDLSCSNWLAKRVCNYGCQLEHCECAHAIEALLNPSTLFTPMLLPPGGDNKLTTVSSNYFLDEHGRHAHPLNPPAPNTGFSSTTLKDRVREIQAHFQSRNNLLVQSNTIIPQMEALPIVLPLKLGKPMSPDMFDPALEPSAKMQAISECLLDYDQFHTSSQQASAFWDQMIDRREIADIPLFGEKHNPLAPVVHLLSMINGPKTPALILEYLFNVTLTYYATINQRWLRKSVTSPTFDEAGAEYLLVLYPQEDFLHVSDMDMMEACPVEELAKTSSYVVFFRRVAIMLYNRQLLADLVTVSSICSFVSSRLCGSIAQLLETLKWALNPVESFEPRIQSTFSEVYGGAAYKQPVVQYSQSTFKKTKRFYRYGLAARLDPGIFACYTHSVFTPYRPCLTLPHISYSIRGVFAIDPLLTIQHRLPTDLKSSALQFHTKRRRKLSRSRASDATDNAVGGPAAALRARNQNAVRLLLDQSFRKYPMLDPNIRNFCNDAHSHIASVRNTIRELDEMMFHLLWSTQRSLEDHYRKHMNVRMDACKMGLQYLYGTHKVSLMYAADERAALHPRVPRYLHHRLFYATRQEDNIGVTLHHYIPSLVQPGWHVGPKLGKLEYLPPVRTPCGMSDSQLLWLINQGKADYDMDTLTGILKQHFWLPGLNRPPTSPRQWVWVEESKSRYHQGKADSILSEWWTRTFLKYPASQPRNLFLDWVVFVRLLPTQAAAMAALYECSFVVNSPNGTPANCISELRRDQRSIIQRLLDTVNNHQDVNQVNLHNFFDALSARWDSNYALVPTASDISLLLDAQTVPNILCSDYPTVDEKDHAKHEVLENVCSMTNAILAWRPWSECPATGTISFPTPWPNESPCKYTLTWKQFYLQILLKVVERHIFPAMVLWQLFMAPDHLFYTETPSGAMAHWTKMLVERPLSAAAVAPSSAALQELLRTIEVQVQQPEIQEAIDMIAPEQSTPLLRVLQSMASQERR